MQYRRKKFKFVISSPDEFLYGAVIIAKGHCKSSPDSFDECRLSASWPPTPDQVNQLGLWVRRNSLLPSASIIAIYYYSARILILILPCHRGWKTESTYCSKGVQPVPKAVYGSGCCDKHNCPWWDLNLLGPLTSQSGMLPLGHYLTLLLRYSEVGLLVEKSPILTHTICIFAPVGDNQFEFHQNLWHQKIIVP